MSSINSDSEIGERLQSFRQEQGLSQSAMAKVLDISLRTYQNYERGERSITKEFICAFCDNFDASPEWLLTGKLSNSAAIDLEMLETIITTVEEFLESESLTLCARKKSKLISLLYKLYSENNELSQDTVHGMLQLSVG